MPNWVKNIVRIEGPKDNILKAIDLMRDKEPLHEDDIDFNNLIPMPDRLHMVSGGYDKYYVALYLNSISEDEKQKLIVKLSAYPVRYYGNYFLKYSESFMMDVPNNFLNRMRDTFMNEYRNISPVSIEDVGKAYIDNILEYGADTWYDWCCERWGTKWNASNATILEDGFDFNTAWNAPFPIIEELSSRFPGLVFTHEWADEDLGWNCGHREYINGVIFLEDHINDYEFSRMIWGYDPDDFEEE